MATRPDHLVFLREHLIDQLPGLKQSLKLLVELLVQRAQSQLALARRHVLQTLQAAEGLIVRVFEAAVLDLVELAERRLTEIAVDSLIVLDEVLHAAEARAHATDRLGDRYVHFGDFAGAVAVACGLIWRVYKVRENVEVFPRTCRAERSLVAHAK